MAWQVQIRRDTAANLALATPALAELIYDTTNKRLGVGDGTSTADTQALFALMRGDLHKMAPIAATAGGTADAITITLDPAPTAWVTFMTMLVKIASNNTGPATINPNGIGAKTIKKNAGADDLDADELVAGGLYLMMYDGTNVQIISGAGGSGGMVPLEQKTGAAASYDFFTGFDGSYRSLVLKGWVVPVTDDVAFMARFSDDGSTFEADSGDYSHASGGFSAEAGPTLASEVKEGGLSDTKIVMSDLNAGLGVGSTSGECAMFEAFIENPASTTLYTQISWRISYKAASATSGGDRQVSMEGAGGQRNTFLDDVLGVQLLFDSGNIEDGDVTLYGVPSA